MCRGSRLRGRDGCGGAPIHRKWVLIAGHCVEGGSPSSIRVVLGDHRVSVTAATEQVRTVSRFVLHPNFRYIGGAPVDDVALIALSSSVSIPSSYQFPDAIVSGWGWTGAYGSSSDALRQTKLKIQDNSRR
ncbi:trypsin-like serine protease [Archangium violaceum]|nr:trypsin-like serine protease [Archangium violaceum]